MSFYRRTTRAEIQAVAEAMELTGGHRQTVAKLTGIDTDRLRMLIWHHAILPKWKNPQAGRPIGLKKYKWLHSPPQPARTLTGLHSDLKTRTLRWADGVGFVKGLRDAQK